MIKIIIQEGATLQNAATDNQTVPATLDLQGPCVIYKHEYTDSILGNITRGEYVAVNEGGVTKLYQTCDVIPEYMSAFWIVIGMVFVLTASNLVKAIFHK